MKKLKYILEAVIVLGIALAFVTPGAATVPKQEKIINEMPELPIPIFLKNARGWEIQDTNFWVGSRGIDYVYCVDENIVWCTAYDGSGGGEVIQEFTKTSDGGENWEADTMFLDPFDGEPAMICAIDENTAWIPLHSGDPQGIWKTSDGGETWTRQDTALFSGDGAFPNIVHFWDENNGWCQGDPVDGYYEMYTTTDGGENWVRVPEENIPPPLDPIEYGVVGYYDVVGDTIWWGTTQNYPLRVFKSTDRGYTWTASEVPFEAGAYVDPRFVDQNNGMAINRVNEFPPEFAGTSDGGETWEIIEYEGKAYNFALDSVPGSTNMFVTTGVTTGVEEENGASYSYDGGYTWQEFEEVDGVQLSNTDWVEGRIGWAGNFNDPDDPSIGGIYKYKPSEIANLECSGNLAWAEVGAGSTQNGEFTVLNEGSPLTFLNWEIDSYPSWGTWQFNPESGTDLIGGEETNVQVTVIAPGDTDSEFTGEVTLVNSDDPGDSCIVYVYLSTPRVKPPINPFFLRLLEMFPNSFPVLRLLLGL